MSARHGPGISRRGFLSASAAGLGAASAAGLTAACSGPGAATAGPAADRPAPGSREFTNAVLDAFQTRRLVGLGEAHGLQNHHDALEALLSDPRLPQVVDDIVVEFGNALYQPVMDRFTAGQPVDNADLRPAWRNTTQSPAGTWDQPVYEQFFRTVRAANWTLPPDRRIRVLLGDPPLDWSKITDYDQLRPILAQRDSHAAMVVETQVLGKGRRALLCYGAEHLQHSTPGNIAGIVQQRTGERTYTIADIATFLAGDPGRLARSLAAYARNTVIPTAGTWLGAFDAGLFMAAAGFSGGPGGRAQPPSFCGMPLRSFIDAGLYLGQPGDLTLSWWDPAIYLDPVYWAELQRRNAIKGNTVNLNSYRQEQPVQLPVPSLPSSLECGKAAHAS